MNRDEEIIEQWRAEKGRNIADVFDLLEIIRRVREDEREQCAELVSGWHIKKGGYTNLAEAIRARTESKEARL